MSCDKYTVYSHFQVNRAEGNFYASQNFQRSQTERQRPRSKYKHYKPFKSIVLVKVKLA